jgi:hypothetical protein
MGWEGNRDGLRKRMHAFTPKRAKTIQKTKLISDLLTDCDVPRTTPNRSMSWLEKGRKMRYARPRSRSKKHARLLVRSLLSPHTSPQRHKTTKHTKSVRRAQTEKSRELSWFDSILLHDICRRAFRSSATLLPLSTRIQTRTRARTDKQQTHTHNTHTHTHTHTQMYAHTSQGHHSPHTSILSAQGSW